jgi:lipopolysaccharide/colanic/teichoic acid biosynthesis glycosyltransferase
LNAAPNTFAAAILTAAMVSGSFWLCGLYRRSYSIYARDEVYYACAAVIFAAAPCALILYAVGEVPVVSIAIALLLCALGTSVWRVRMHLNRRQSNAPYAGIQSITLYGWRDRESQMFLLTRRAFDLIVAVAALALAFPIMLAAAIAVAIESGAPVLFKQQRVGRDGRVFILYKFRTMKRDAGAEWARPGDDRITRAGAFLRRTSIDELPQLFNVVRGDMSIVGPRPEMVEFARGFAKKLPSYDQRHVVTPGITGWAQLYIKRTLDPSDVADVLPYDLFYVERASLVLDTALLLKTIAEVLFHRAV